MKIESPGISCKRMIITELPRDLLVIIMKYVRARGKNIKWIYTLLKISKFYNSPGYKTSDPEITYEFLHTGDERDYYKYKIDSEYVYLIDKYSLDYDIFIVKYRDVKLYWCEYCNYSELCEITHGENNETLKCDFNGYQMKTLNHILFITIIGKKISSGVSLKWFKEYLEFRDSMNKLNKKINSSRDEV